MNRDELLKEAKELVKVSYHKKYSEKNSKQLGFLLRYLTGRDSVWTLKDLDDNELQEFINECYPRMFRRLNKED